MYKSRKSFALSGSAVVASFWRVAMTIVAANNVETYKNLATGVLSGRNAARQVYTSWLQQGQLQKWR
jgi:hypothetical protein